jgi:hypothetical protein
MTQYSILLNKKGMILSFEVIDADPQKLPSKNLKGRHFSRLIGLDCKEDLRSLIKETTKTRIPGTFRTFSPPKGFCEGPVVEWTIQPKVGWLFVPTRYLVVGKEPE